MADVKICGVADDAALDAALRGGARFIGLVFFPKSPRHLSLERAASLAARARGRVEVVAVTVNADDAFLAALSQTVRPDYLQLHGAESPVRAAAARPFALKGVIKSLSVATPADLSEAAAYAPVSDWLLFDAKPPPGATLPGGNGAAFDWTILKGFKSPRPWLLSGGLDARNVGRALTASGASALDVSSGVESAPGVKDPGEILAFLAAAGANPEAKPSNS
jgi:phosphoribosylanthranilate isomerase